jgi:hypothetical protein
MITTNEDRSAWIPNNVTDWRLYLGREFLEQRDAIREGIALAGAPGVLSLFEALIASDEHLCRDDLLRTVHALCRTDMTDAVEELLDLFAGDDPRRHLWIEGKSGYYQLLGPHDDFPN